MKVAFVTNIRAPYRTLQMESYSEIENIELNIYYTYPDDDGRLWEKYEKTNLKEYDLNVLFRLKSYGCLNKGIIRLVKENDLIMLGGYEQPTMICMSILCKILKKPYIVFFDGISTNKLNEKENKFKKILKNLVIKNANYIMANGEVGRRYFNEKFNVENSKIYNQYLAIDNDKIRNLAKDKLKYRKFYRDKLNIGKDEKVLLYSGRLVDVKNVESVVETLSKIKNEKITFLITGGGELEEKIKILANELNVKIIITGFINNQEELFKYYFVADVFILPSKNEAWGLVVNEAMNAGLPILVSDICGCSLDLVKNNGHVINPFDIDDIKEKLGKMFYEANLDYMSEKSKEIISEWTFENSKRELLKIIKNLEGKNV